MHRTQEHEGSLHPFILPFLSLYTKFLPSSFSKEDRPTPVSPSPAPMIKLCLSPVCSGTHLHSYLPPQRPLPPSSSPLSISCSWRNYGKRKGWVSSGWQSGEEGCDHALLWATVCCAFVGSGTLMGASYGSLCGYGRMGLPSPCSCSVLTSPAQTHRTSQHDSMPCILEAEPAAKAKDSCLGE